MVKKLTEVADKKTPIPEQPANERNKNFNEVALGYGREQAMAEAERCIQCKKPRCIKGCPVEIDIRGFIQAITDDDLPEALRILKRKNAFPAICGRVCPQESQCESFCVVGKKKEAVGIGRLERYVADWGLANEIADEETAPPSGHKVAIIGSGPAGLTVAADLAREGVEVTIFEALHVVGGVLKYGIPEFRLPKRIIDREVELLKKLGVKIETNKIIGRLFTIPMLLEEKGFDAVFIGSGAGFPRFMNIPGEGVNGVFSANEYLTRVNLMVGWDHPIYDTPVGMGKHVAVIGAGNTAMDAARVSVRMGAETVHIVYRRTSNESPARAEEREHALEEGVIFKWLTQPINVIADDKGWATGMECLQMELGEPDDSGRRRPVPIEGSNFTIKCDTIVDAIGTQANPIIARTTPGLEINQWGYIVTNPETNETSIPNVYAGGDIVTGGATVILAMGAGRVASRAMLNKFGLCKEEVVACATD